ncbi:DUF3090 family protein [SAR202 cluster bacterium AC-409-J13_OGT_754m]|nr:DUF3090 family protein [SAR202 cluster bacterium AC-409-J13_OGT_754m]
MEQYQSNNSFGLLTEIGVEAVGKPGNRTFRLSLGAGEAQAVLWLEKEQLQQLAIYIQQIEESLSPAKSSQGNSVPEDTWNGGPTFVEFQVGGLSMGHDSPSNAFLFLIYGLDTEENFPADLSFWISGEMADNLSRQALQVCAAGRPRCFLCDKPIGPDGHKCMRSNGHQAYKG